MFPNKNKMVKNANTLLAALAIGPAVYIFTATPVALSSYGLARDPNIVPLLFLGLLAVSVANIGGTIHFQTSEWFMVKRGPYDPMGRTYLVCSLGAILSETHSIYGLVLTMLSGSITYAIGFSLVTWASLIWVRAKFKQKLGTIPDSKLPLIEQGSK